jgi:hypothetical protein
MWALEPVRGGYEVTLNRTEIAIRLLASPTGAESEMSGSRAHT